LGCQQSGHCTGAGSGAVAGAVLADAALAVSPVAVSPISAITRPMVSLRREPMR
jgi:hypothetical protein